MWLLLNKSHSMPCPEFFIRSPSKSCGNYTARTDCVCLELLAKLNVTILRRYGESLLFPSHRSLIGFIATPRMWWVKSPLRTRCFLSVPRVCINKAALTWFWKINIPGGWWKKGNCNLGQQWREASGKCLQLNKLTKYLLK